MGNVRAQLGDVAMVGGRIAKVIAINEQRSITFEFVGGTPCPTCGRDDRIELNEGCMLWDESVRSVTTCGKEPEPVRPPL